MRLSEFRPEIVAIFLRVCASSFHYSLEPPGSSVRPTLPGGVIGSTDSNPDAGSER
jgi:hypothetical protein